MRILPLFLGLLLLTSAASVPAEDSFTIAVIPDTQQEVLGANDTRFKNRLQYLLNQRAALNIKVMCQVGDLVNWDTPDHIQYERASAGLKLLDDARLPYVLSIGNHDTYAVGEGGSARDSRYTKEYVRNTDTFNRYFPISRHQIIRGTHMANKMDTAYHTFTAGDRNWLVINVELWPRTDHITYVKNILNAHPNHNAIIVTHSYLNGDRQGSPTNGYNSIYSSNGGYGANSPLFMWDQALKGCANVRMTFSGHVGSHGYRVDTGTNGNKVYSFLQNYASNFDNYVRLLTINTRTGTIQSRMANPIKGVDANDGSTFTVTGVSWVGTGTTPVDVAPSITGQPTSRTVNAGQTATFSVSASGTPAPTFQWQKNGGNISGATGSSYTTPATVSSDNGATFRCVVTNRAGSATSSSATLTVNAPAQVGNGTGLSGMYFNNQDLTGTSAARRDARIDFTWSETTTPISGIGAGTYSIRWAGQVQAQYSQTYTFSTTSDDGVRLWVNGRLLVDQWNDHSPTEHSGTIALTAGTRYDIALEYYQAMGGARIALAWSSPSTAKQIVPTSQLYPGGVPSPWVAQDIGGAQAGNGYVTGDTVVVTGAGGDIYQASDSGRLFTQPLTGDGTIIARVVSMTNTNQWAKAGVMIREGTAANAKHAFCFVTPVTTNGVGFIRRTSTGAAATYNGGSKNVAPRWLRLVRSGTVITASESGDGVNWTMVGSVTMSLANPVRIGFAVTSGDNSRLCTAVFDVVSITPAGNG